MPIYFFRPTDVNGYMSNFSRHEFMLKNVRWATAEHYFQAQKFVGTRHEELIRLTQTATAAKELGRDRHRPLRRDWDQVKDDVMRAGVRAKFSGHPRIQAELLATGDEEIIMFTRQDEYWGSGAYGTGKNMLGRILMEIRAELREPELISRAVGESAF